MTTKKFTEHPVSIVRNGLTPTLHLVTGSGTSGIVFFCCEQAPLLTFPNQGLPAHCPICRTTNPLKGEAQKNA